MSDALPSGAPTANASNLDLRALIDAMVAVDLPRSELPEWTAHVSKYVDDGTVLVMDPNLVRSPIAPPRSKPEPLMIAARRSLTYMEQEAAVRLFLAKRDTPSETPDV